MSRRDERWGCRGRHGNHQHTYRRPPADVREPLPHWTGVPMKQSVIGLKEPRLRRARNVVNALLLLSTQAICMAACDGSCPRGTTRIEDICVPKGRELNDFTADGGSASSEGSATQEAEPTAGSGRTRSSDSGSGGSTAEVNARDTSQGGKQSNAGDVNSGRSSGGSGGSTSKDEPRCGNGIVEPGEVCDGNCPTSCPHVSNCLHLALVGAPATCDVHCEPQEIKRCLADDECCPSGCSHATDSDCSAKCGDGVLDVQETCEPTSQDKPCPASCDDGDACTADKLVGSAAECSAHCSHTPIVAAVSGDGCCPRDANAANDADCKAACGDGMITGVETCDPASQKPCPGSSDCDDRDPCTRDLLEGSAAQCTAKCTHTPITAAIGGDGCCPPNTTFDKDGDCSGCGDGVRQVGEQCDPASDGPFTCATDCKRQYLYTACSLDNNPECGDPTHQRMACVNGTVCMPRVADFDVASCPKIDGYPVGILWGNYCALWCNSAADCPPHAPQCKANDERAKDPAREVLRYCHP